MTTCLVFLTVCGREGCRKIVDGLSSMLGPLFDKPTSLHWSHERGAEPRVLQLIGIGIGTKHLFFGDAHVRNDEDMVLF